MFPGLESPQKGIVQQMSQCGQLQLCVKFPYDNHYPVILQQDANLIILPLWDTFVHINSFLWFYDRMRNSHFYYSNWLQLMATCDATICSWTEAAKLGNSWSP